MTAYAAPAQPHAIASAGHGHALPARRQMNAVGLWLFFVSECFLFGALLAVRFYIAGSHKPEELNQELGLAITSVLLLSSLTAFSAETAISRGRRGLAGLFLLATIALGIVFFGGVVYEWSSAEFTQGEPYGTAFFTMTGLHASHVISGIGILTLLLLQVMRGRFSPDSYWGFEASIKYWHFVDVVWVFYYPCLYLIN
jgi:cytochrome c oxidase subunit III